MGIRVTIDQCVPEPNSLLVESGLSKRITTSQTYGRRSNVKRQDSFRRANGQTLLHIAASTNENPAAIELLLDRGADIHGKE